jgi:hypothetical protein
MKIKFLKRSFFILVIFFCFGAQSALAQVPDLSSLDILAIKSFNIKSDDINYYMTAVVILKNSADKAIKLKKVNFDLSFKEQNSSDIIKVVSNAPIEETIIPAKPEDSDAGTNDIEIVLILGPKDDATVNSMIKFFNIIGNPSNTIVMSLYAKGDIGYEKTEGASKGWIYQTGMAAELDFMPTIQKEILFK